MSATPRADDLPSRLRKNAQYDFASDLADDLNDAADEIERLNGVISDGAKWIPVTERLPQTEDYGQVLAINSVGYKACVTYIYKNTDGLWDGECETPEECIDAIGDITHWMPIPEGPK